MAFVKTRLSPQQNSVGTTMTQLKSNATASQADPTVRALELGAKIVTATGTKVVLQMPRGNLAEIHPRPLMFNHLAPLFER